MAPIADPFDNLHSDVFSLIFQHLSSRELLTLSTVNLLWYKTIGMSPNCMNKLKINIQCSLKLNSNDLQTTSRVQSELNPLISIRQYRNIYADFTQQNKRKILEILSDRKWKNVELLNENFKDGNFLGHFHENVESLNLTRINCDDESLKEFLFPRLQRLKISSSNDLLVKNLENCSSLTTLNVHSKCDSRSMQKSLTNLLINNKNLEALTLITHQSLLRTQIIMQCKFNLKKLVIDNTGFLKEDRECLAAFLESQTNSLEVIDITPWCGAEVIAQCFRMAKLKDFTCNIEDQEESLDNVNLNCNYSIKRLNLRNVEPFESQNFYEMMFRNAPNLKVYKANLMQFADLISLSTRCKVLEELYIEDFDVAVLPNGNCFPNLKRFKSWSINDELMKSLKAKGAKNTFEELILSF